MVASVFVLARVADDGHCTDDKQPPQVSIALLGDAVEAFLAARAILLWHRADPGPISATSAVAPMPGISANRRLASQARCRTLMISSMEAISAPTV
jgi:hypothetical protein